MKNVMDSLKSLASRRSFIKNNMVAAGTVGGAAGLLGNLSSLFGQGREGVITRGDVAILRFLAAAEIIESDLWVQYNELGGTQDSEVPGITGGSAAYITALEQLDGDMPQYIHDNTEDEITHYQFINAYLTSMQAAPVNLDSFRTLPAVKRPAPGKSDGSPTSCSLPWTRVGGPGTAAPRTTPISILRSLFLKQSRH
jgi:hypothetical protein